MNRTQIAISQKNEAFIKFSDMCRENEIKAGEIKKAFSSVTKDNPSDIFGREIKGLEKGMLVFWVDESMSIYEEMLKIADVVI